MGKAVSAYAAKCLAVKDDTWLATFDGTAREFAEKIGIRPGETGSGLVLSIGSFSGRAAPEIWEWLKVNWPADGK